LLRFRTLSICSAAASRFAPAPARTPPGRAAAVVIFWLDFDTADQGSGFAARGDLASIQLDPNFHFNVIHFGVGLLGSARRILAEVALRLTSIPSFAALR
jgi:hypothetical protein